MKIAGVSKNSGHCIYSIGLKCLLMCLVCFTDSFMDIYIVADLKHHASTTNINVTPLTFASSNVSNVRNIEEQLSNE